MKQKKLLQRMKEFFAFDKSEQRSQKEEFEIILGKLRKRENSLKEKLAAENNKKIRKRLKRDIDVIKAQRKKGQKLLNKSS